MLGRHTGTAPGVAGRQLATKPPGNRDGQVAKHERRLHPVSQRQVRVADRASDRCRRVFASGRHRSNSIPPFAPGALLGPDDR